MTISEVSKKYDISIETLRYYERIGIIPKISRNKSGIRDYTEEDCNWVYYMKCMKSAGLSIESLVEYRKLFEQGKETIDSRKELLIKQRQYISEKINEMQQTLERLDYKIDNYETRMLKYEDEKIKKVN